jgi:polysaccharide export outer membrane protein
MRLTRIHPSIWRRAFTEPLRVPVIFLLLFCVFAIVPGVFAQHPNNSSRMNPSDLAVQNLSRVSASAAEIKAVLGTDPGLLVELKRWVAKDATDHGQIIGEEDLTSEAIYEKLESDVQFRSVATALLQRYGYLLPKYNPDSEVGKERELLIQERTKWLAQRQEEELAQARQRDSRTTQTSNICDSGIDKRCGSPQNRISPTEGLGQNPRFGVPSPGTVPERQNPPDLPRPGATREQLAQLLQSGPDASDVFSPISVSSPYGATSAASNPSLNSNGGLAQQVLGAASDGPDGPSSLASARDIQIARGRLGPDMTGSASGSPLDPNGMAGVGNNATTSFDATGSRIQPFDGRYQPWRPSQTPEMIRKPSPYNDIPSLYDMYVQAAARPTTPTRFGAEVFENGTRDSQLIPMDLPVGPDYVVGPGDGLAIDIWGGVSQRLYRTVDREGRVSLPEVGPLLVSGKSLADVQQNLQQVLRTQFRDISTDVSLARLRTIRVYEVGDVTHPGAYDISSLSTPLNALFAAGGPTPKGSIRILKHYRGNQLVQVVDVYDLLLHGVKTDLKRLENGDTVLVPPIGPQVTVEGMVRRPAIYELKDEKTLASVLELAGGLLPTAALRHIEVQRLVAHDKQTMLSLDIPESADASAVTKKLESFQVQDGDRIRVFPIAPYNQNAIYLEGHVIRPGRYSYHADMRVTDVISSYKDLLPEPATQYAEIVRLNPPDYRPSVESFNLADAFANPSGAPLLHPMDTVRIFSRFDFENPPAVSVLGDVRMPGTYQTSGQIHLSDAIHLAGGLSPDAQTADAQVFRYMPDGTFKIFSVSLGQALQGDPIENIILYPRDRILIHRNPDAVQPATVYLQGEVAKPGRYPLTTNMRVADLIRVGGGLKPSAERQTADLTQYRWSDQAKLTGEHQTIALSAALTGDPNSNTALHNGDVLTIGQLPGWNDLGASVVVKGEVNHPGTYGIKPGERLSSVLARAGGFLPTAYPRGIVFERQDVRKLEQKSRDELIQRIRQEGVTFKTSIQETGQDQAALAQAALAQRNSVIEGLQQAPVTGRLVVRMPSDVARFRGSPDDIELRRGDTIFIPKMPEFVVVTGQVYNSNAITYRVGHNARWYLRQAGGPTDQANKKAIFVIRANGSVVSNQGSGLWNGSVLSTAIEPGDTIVVPEKAIGGASAGWKNLIAIAQLAQAAATTAFIAAQ